MCGVQKSKDTCCHAALWVIVDLIGIRFPALVLISHIHSMKTLPLNLRTPPDRPLISVAVAEEVHGIEVRHNDFTALGRYISLYERGFGEVSAEKPVT